jgi:hypothetical protein
MSNRKSITDLWDVNETFQEGGEAKDFCCRQGINGNKMFHVGNDKIAVG